ncbi:MAG: NAD-dependent epimerase/dehydratase family protein [Phycisphaerales bacterium]|jgi:2'-hydroxyisoflavone reductase|nr:NAD-dependent epimerase/dehydratase family protein [Phycisphaerales bacterium]
MKILVLGGTGFLGPHEIDQFEDRGWEITIFNRGRSKTDLFQADFAKVTRLTGDRDPKKGDGLDAIARAIESGETWDAVVDNSAYVPRIAKASAELLKNATRQYVFISTISVYAENATAGADESAAVGTMEDPTDENVSAYYGQLKALCEQEVERVFDDRATIIRPGLIVGPGDKTDRFTYWPVRCRRGGEVLIPSENPRTQFIDVRDLAGFITTCVEQGHGGVYNATGPEGPLYFREMVDGCKAVVSSPVEFVPVPESFLQAEEVGPWMGPNTMAMWIPLVPEMAGFGQRSNRAAIEHGCRFRPLADTAKATLDWFLASERQNEDLGLRAGLSPAREKELIAKWREEAANDA